MTSLFLLRHAHAGNPDRWTGDDDLRPLSDKGRRQAERLAALLGALDEPPDLFVTSPRVRAAETAEIVAGVLGSPVVVDDRLAGPLGADLVEGILADAADAAAVAEAGDAGRPCLVGHDPAFSELLGELLGIDGLPMRKGALARVEIDRPVQAGTGVLRWLLPPDAVADR